MIRVTAQINIDEREIEESFVRASGPGGQNVNKLSTAVQLRFDVRRSPSLPATCGRGSNGSPVRRLTRDGVLVIIAQRHRTQARNRQDALDRLIDLIRRARSRRSSGGRPSRPRPRASAASKARSAAPGIKHLRRVKAVVRLNKSLRTLPVYPPGARASGSPPRRRARRRGRECRGSSSRSRR